MGFFGALKSIAKVALPVVSSSIPGGGAVAKGVELASSALGSKSQSPPEASKMLGNSENTKEAVQKQAKENLEALQKKSTRSAVNVIKEKIQADPAYADEIYARLTKKKKLSPDEKELLAAAKKSVDEAEMAIKTGKKLNTAA